MPSSLAHGVHFKSGVCPKFFSGEDGLEMPAITSSESIFFSTGPRNTAVFRADGMSALPPGTVDVKYILPASEPLEKSNCAAK